MPVVEGVLKRKTRFKGWRPRYYVLWRSGQLKEYDSEASRISDKPRHVLEISRCQVERGGGGETKRQHCFSIIRLNAAALVLQAQDKKQQRKWIKSIRMFATSASRDIGIDLEVFKGATVAADEVGMILGINTATTQLLGYSPKDLLQANVAQLATGVHQANHAQYMSNYLSSGDRKLIGRPRRVRARHKDGREIPVVLSLSEFFEGDARRFMANMMLDNESAQTLDIESFASASIAATPRGIIVAANSLLCQYFGYRKAELLGSNVSVLMPPHLAARHDSYLERFERTGYTNLIGHPRRLVAKHRDGTPLAVILVLGVILEAGQKILLATVSPDAEAQSSLLPRSEDEEGDWDESDTRTDDTSSSAGHRTHTSSTVHHQSSQPLSESSSHDDPFQAAISAARSRILSSVSVALGDELGNIAQAHRSKLARTTSQIASSSASSSSSSEKLITVSLSDIVIQDRITGDRGSAASVYECLIDGWLCAMKELDLKRCTDATLSAFEAEIEFSSTLPRHPNVCRYLGHERLPDKLRLFMTRYRGNLTQELMHMREVQKDLSPADVARLLNGLINGLQCLHDRGIIHRDLKSDNIFISYKKKGVIASLVIGDFDGAKQGGALTIAGTPGYMAPEVYIRNPNQPYTAAADVWSLGMVLFEMITLERPSANLTALEIQQNLIAGKRATLPDNVDPKYKQFITMYKSMTQKEPSKRTSLQELGKILVKMI
jgi:PAS domain S-box-containing protein